MDLHEKWKGLRNQQVTYWHLSKQIKFGVFLVPFIVSEPHLLKGEFSPTYERVLNL